MRRNLVTWVGAAMVLLAVPTLAPAAETSCITCHSDTDMFDPETAAIVQDFTYDVHGTVGLSCHDCHGGNPSPDLATDMFRAMDPDFEENPYRGAPETGQVPSFCGRCHSDPTFMKRFKPDARVDQEEEYWTSQHGHLLEGGNTRVATCISCHGVHGIRRPTDSESMVYPARVADTCRTCHGDAKTMAGSTLPDGRPFPIDQYARWRQSVHAAAMYEKEDLSAPTCNDCHGNHGATPPGLDSVTFVCGQCHGREAELFRASPKETAFQLHNEMLAESDGEGCPACHEAPDPQSALTGVLSLGECTACHGNHGIVRPTIGMLSPPPPTPCEFCHSVPDSAELVGAEPEPIRKNHEAKRDALVAQAEELGLTGEDMYNWLVDQAQTLPNHLLTATDDDGNAVPRPEFARLWSKFRMGKTVYTYEDPVTGEPVEARVVRCDTCHAREPQMTDSAAGLEASHRIMQLMHGLMATTARAERVLLRARRGGVETRDALLDIDQAVDAQIELEVLIHSFDFAEGSVAVQRQQEGLDHAVAGLKAGWQALDELAYRRRGLMISLAFIALVLIGLALKIRQLSAR